jgi:glycosyltransferase involved in cell wall biosynthesis
MSPRVSVVIPAFDAENTVGAAISSVLWQTYRDFEAVVADDGSTDATGAIAASFPAPVRVVTQSNRGVAAARNLGIAEARGELIAFCDADDVLLPGHLEALLEVYDRNGGIATANHYWLLPGGIHPSKQRYKGGFPVPQRQRQAILEQNFVSTMSVFPKVLTDEIGPFNEERRVAEDWDFWLRAIFAGQRVSLQPRPLALYRWGDTGLSTRREEMDAQIEALLRAAAQRERLTEPEQAYLKRRLEGPDPRRLIREGDDALRRGRYPEAARRLREAAELCPSERRLVWKSRSLRLAPRLVGPLIRHRQDRIERQLGFEEGHVR